MSSRLSPPGGRNNSRRKVPSVRARCVTLDGPRSGPSVHARLVSGLAELALTHCARPCSRVGSVPPPSDHPETMQGMIAVTLRSLGDLLVSAIPCPAGLATRCADGGFRGFPVGRSRHV
jgi:hypothetical protein